MVSMYAMYVKKNMFEYVRILQKIAYIGYICSSFDGNVYDVHQVQFAMLLIHLWNCLCSGHDRGWFRPVRSG